jgi:3-phenylpropionate/trans-cinnamate dioxygenase ferredoxin reductase subunit
MRSSVVIVGGGAGGIATARGLRDKGFDGSIEIVSDEELAPYERPPLSKEFLRKEAQPADLRIVPDEWYLDNDVVLRLGVRATMVNLHTREVVTGSGAPLPFDHLVIATGGRPRRVELGLAADRVFYLRSVADATRLRAVLQPGRHVAILGAGFIGSELAASARSMGVDVTMIEALATPMARVVGLAVGALFSDIHREHGVRMLTNTTVQCARSSSTGVVLELDDGKIVECDALVIGAGMVPNVELAAAAGLRCANGVSVNAMCRASAPGVYAVGDVAAHDHPLFDAVLRVEHHENALRQGAAVAANIVGEETEYADPHWFWSDQYDHNLQAVGLVGQGDDVVVRGSLNDRRFTIFWRRDGIVVGALGLNCGMDVRRASRLVSLRHVVDPNDLRNPDIDLRKVSCTPQLTASERREGKAR